MRLTTKKNFTKYEITCKSFVSNDGAVICEENSVIVDSVFVDASFSLYPVLSKTRYKVPMSCGHILEVDVFDAPFYNCFIAEVEFESVEDSETFFLPWAAEEVTGNSYYSNAEMYARLKKKLV